MKTTRYLIVAILVGTVAWNSPAVRAASAEESSAWQEAKSAFTPVNELRDGVRSSAPGAEQGTTVRVFGVESGADLTVYPPATTAKSVEPQVVNQPVSRGNTELVLLPAVESEFPSPTNLVSNQTSGSTSYAIRAFTPEGTAPAQTPAEQFLQSSAPPQKGPMVVPSGCCCDSCCDSCGGGCCNGCCCQPCIVVVGTEFVFVSPTTSGDSVGAQFDNFTDDTVTLLGPGVDDAAINDFYAAPRVWIGVQGPCWGIGARYYHFRAWENAHDLFVPPAVTPGDLGFDISNMLEAYYTDIEVTRNFCLHGCKNQFAFGVRHGSLEHVETLWSALDADAGMLEGSARRYRESHGTGLLVGLNGRKPLFCNSCAHWFYSARGSILWGPSTYEAQTIARADSAGGSAESIDGASVVIDEDLFIAEAQFGLQWDFALRCLPAKAFFRTAFEYQYWDAASGFAQAGSFAGYGGGTPTEVVSTQADAAGLIVDFVGLSIGTGFTW